MNSTALRSALSCLATLVLLAGTAAYNPFTPTGALMAQDGPNQVIDPSWYQDLRWRNVGPHRGGRATAVAGVRQQPCTFYMGATGGGVWKTTSCGQVWQPVSDGQIATGSIGSIDVSESHPDVVYVGTGSAAIRSNVIIGRGAYKSIDAGATWQFVGLKDSGQIGELEVHPTNPDVVWLAALGSPYGPNDERGVFKTTDGGRTWRKTLFVNRETGARAIAVNKSNPNEIYAAMHRAFRKGWDIISGGPATEGGIYKSLDGGETWNKLSGGLPSGLIGRIDIDIARSQSRIVYAMVEAPGAEGGLYRSDDAGASWRLVNNEHAPRDRPFYFHYVDVNPKNPDEVWVHAEDLFKSSDGGRTLTPVAIPHGDSHGMWFNPEQPNTAVHVNDGGANVTHDGGETWSTILNQPTAELYMVSVDEQHPYRLYVPQQDNSTLVMPSVPPVSWSFDHQSMAWFQASGCETGQIVPRADGKVIYGVCKGEFGRYSVDSGQESHYWVYPQYRYGHHPDDIRFRFPRQGVVFISRHDPAVIYHASHVLHRTRTEGQTWETISPDLTAHEKEFQVVPGNPITRDISGEEVYSSIYAFTDSRLEPGVLWVGANDGPVHVSRDDGRTWKNVTPKGLPPGGRVQTIEDSPHRKGAAYVAVYRYLREHDLRPYLYATSDYGETWTLLTDGNNGIPADQPTRVVREDPDRAGLLYAGTELGMFVSFDAGSHWQPLQLNLPATPVTDLRVHRKDLVISTMGRSLWILDDVSPLHQLMARRTTSAAPALLQPRNTVRYRHATMGVGPDVPEYPPVAATIDYLLPAQVAGLISIEILDAKGRLVRSLAAGAASAAGGQGMRGPRRGPPPLGVVTSKPGHNRVRWDYRWGEGGPMVAPGVFTVRMNAGGSATTTTFTVAVDPRVTADGITQADLVEQERFLLELVSTIDTARQLRRRLEAAMTRAGLPTLGPLAAGQRAFDPAHGFADPRYQSPLQVLWARLVSVAEPYPQRMLIDQFQYLQRMLMRADQRVGRDAYLRYEDLKKELEAIRVEVDKAAPLSPRTGQQR